MRIAIMQPTYLPWMGYFALMHQVDRFVLLDDVEFSRQSWQQRNRVKTQDGELWLTIPVYHKGRSGQFINEVEINQKLNWATKHYRTIRQNYGSTEFWNDNEGWLQDIYNHSWRKLCSLNKALIEKTSRRLGIGCNICLSSEIMVDSADRSERLIQICHLLGADEYLSPIGSFEYIEKDGQFSKSDVRLLYQHFEHPTYKQLYGEFIAHLSVIDLLLNEGPRSLEIIRSGMRAPYTSDEVRRLQE